MPEFISFVPFVISCPNCRQVSELSAGASNEPRDDGVFDKWASAEKAPDSQVRLRFWVGIPRR
jgi:hypothetical protein